MLWLYDRDLTAIAALPEAESIISTRRFSGDWSSFTAKLPASSYDAVEAAYFAQVDDEAEVYLIEKPKLKSENGKQFVTVDGREATALLETRVVDAGFTHSGKVGAALKAYMETRLIYTRAIPNVAFGTGETLGDDVDISAEWGSLGAFMLDLLSAASLGIRSRLVDTTIYFDIYAQVDNGIRVGEAYGNAGSNEIGEERADWRNFAIVSGKAKSGFDYRVEVDWTGADELRELHVDGSSIESDPSVSIPYTVGTDDVFHSTAHGLILGNAVKLDITSGGAPLSESTTYYARDVTANTFKLTTDALGGGTPVNITSAGSGSVVSVALTGEQFVAALAAYGAGALANSRRVTYVEASTTSKLSPGEVAWYDSGRWSAFLMIAESTTVREGGRVQHSATFGEPPSTLKKAIRRATR